MLNTGENALLQKIDRVHSVAMHPPAHTHTGDALTRLALNIATIREGLDDARKAFQRIGSALQDIRDGRLYREAGFTNFEQFCRQYFDMGRSYANKLISASAVMQNLGTNVLNLPTCEAQTRALSQLTPTEQILVWRIVEATAPGHLVTAAHIRSVIEVMRELIVTRAIDNGEGESIRVHDLFKAAVVETTYERLMRQSAYIQSHATAAASGAGERLARLQRQWAIARELTVPAETRAAVIFAARRLAHELIEWADVLEEAA